MLTMKVATMTRSHSAMALGLAAALSLAACGAAPEEKPSEAGAGGSGSEFTACMVSDAGGFDDQSFNQSGKEGMDRAAAELGINTIPVQSQSAADYPTNIDSLIQQDCNLIIGVGFNLAKDLSDAAKANPDVNFALIDASFVDEAGEPASYDNARPLLFNTAEAAFLAGYAAAGTSTTGKVATYGGMAIPSVQIFMEGFANGVAQYNEDNGAAVEVLGWDPANPEGGSFVGSFEDTAKGQQLTEQFLSQGADIILPVAGPVGLGTLSSLEAAGSTDNGLIWVDSDGYQSTDGGQYMVTSIIKEIGTSVYDTIVQAESGQFSADPFVGTLANNGVSIAPYYDWETRVPAEVQTRVEELQQQIVDGTLDVSTPYDPS